MIQKKIFFPAIIIALFMVFSLAAINIGYLISGGSVTFVERTDYIGLDYRDFYLASEKLLAGESPYTIFRYVTSPLPAILNTVLVPFGFDTARIIFSILIAFSMLLSYWIVWRLVGLNERKVEGQVILVAGVFIIALSYPFYFLLERGNIDSIVIVLLCLSLYVMRSGNRDWLGGLLFTLAILMKIYPVLLILPLFLYRRWKLIFWIGIWSVLFILLFIPWYPEISKAVIGRSHVFRFDENGSIVNTFFFIIMFLKMIGLPLSITPAALLGIVTYALLISLMIYTDIYFGQNAKFDRFIHSTFMYFPFMVVIPQIAFQYELVNLILLVPILCVVWEITDSKKVRTALLCVTIGLALTQWHAAAAYFLSNNILAHAIPGFGALIAMIGITSYKLTTMIRVRKPGTPLLIIPKDKSFKGLIKTLE